MNLKNGILFNNILSEDASTSHALPTPQSNIKDFNTEYRREVEELAALHGLTVEELIYSPAYCDKVIEAASRVAKTLYDRPLVSAE